MSEKPSILTINGGSSSIKFALYESVKPLKRGLHGKVGHVEDFIIDDETWAIRYLIVDTHNWWPGKKVLVSPQWIERVSWSERKVFVNLCRETIKQSPEYKEELLPTRDYEIGLHGHYNRKGYWVDELVTK
jgi:hypothetical protein